VPFVDVCINKAEFDCNLSLDKKIKIKTKNETKPKVVDSTRMPSKEKINILNVPNTKTVTNLADANDDASINIFETKFKYFSFKYVFICLTSTFIVIFLLIKFLVSRANNVKKAKQRNKFKF
jgi:hypothetical protein